VDNYNTSKHIAKEMRISRDIYLAEREGVLYEEFKFILENRAEYSDVNVIREIIKTVEVVVNKRFEEIDNKHSVNPPHVQRVYHSFGVDDMTKDDLIKFINEIKKLVKVHEEKGDINAD